MDLETLIESVLNALTAGITIGCIYGLMCIGLGLIFGIMKVVNFAQGELLMLGMFASFYLVTGGGVLAFLGPCIGPFVGAILAGPIVFVFGAMLHKFLISRVSGLRTAGSIDDGHFGQLIVTLGISLILQNGGMIVFGTIPVTVRTPLSSSAFLVGPVYGDATIFLNKAKLVACAVAIVTALTLYFVLEFTRVGKALRAAADNPTAATYMGIDVDRYYRMAFGLGSGITAIAGGLMATYFVVRIVHWLRLCDHHVFRRGAWRHRFHHGRVLGRHDGGTGAAIVRAGLAAAVAKRGDLHRVFADRHVAAARVVRPLGGARVT